MKASLKLLQLCATSLQYFSLSSPFILLHIFLPSVVRGDVECESSDERIPDEQRLYRALLSKYARSTRPLQTINNTVVVNFQLSLHQIVDLDERRQILTTSVYIHQTWTDYNLRWNESHYNGIRSLRVRSSFVWLPDTFMLNNADETQSGFLHGIYVNLHSNGTVLWSFPQRLKSSCKVDITYFPFDDQLCTLRFGSWVYSERLVDFKGSLHAVDLSYYIESSEWTLAAIHFRPTSRRYLDSSFPELAYVLRMRRRAFYYVFNIIVPCLMLSVLTLLTFWLPSTSGEKISLGLSVFLTFSMFMLLIAEEVPATSESVPLIGIYIMTVMTMTSVSVIMAVMVINCYHRGQKFFRPPLWANRLVLGWLAGILQMQKSVAAVAESVQLAAEDELRFTCSVHGKPSHVTSQVLYSPRPSFATNPSSNCVQSNVEDPVERMDLRTFNCRSPSVVQTNKREERCPSGGRPDPQHHKTRSIRRIDRISSAASLELRGLIARKQPCNPRGFQSQRTPPPASSNDESELNSERETAAAAEEPVWIRRHSLRTHHRHLQRSSSQTDERDSEKELPILETCLDDDPDDANRDSKVVCAKAVAMTTRKQAIAEWQVMATVIDRLLFWVFLLATVVTYLVILVGLPLLKTESDDYNLTDASTVNLQRSV